jgi:hypothetical protein
VGGAISLESINILKSIQNIYLDRFETRKIIFSANALNIPNLKDGMVDAVHLELLWLKNKKNYYGSIFAEDDNTNTRETNPKFHFHHTTVGGIDHNGIYICQKDLAKSVQIKNAESGLEGFGKCWYPQCRGILHPEELKDIIPEALYNEYRKKFNKKMVVRGGRYTRKLKKYKGGDVESVLHKLKDGTCDPPLLMKKN